MSAGVNVIFESYEKDVIPDSRRKQKLGESLFSHIVTGSLLFLQTGVSFHSQCQWNETGEK